MNYNRLISFFWEENNHRSFGGGETKLYLFLIHVCQQQGWKKTFGVPTRNLEYVLGMSRSRIGEAKRKLKERGLIDFSDGNRSCVPTYTILIPDAYSATVECPKEQRDVPVRDMEPFQLNEETYKELPDKDSREKNIKQYTKANIKQYAKENTTNPLSSSPTPLTIPPYNPPLRGEEENSLPLARMREDLELERFDSMLQEVVDGKCRIWEASVCKKLSIESVQPYLNSFREHVIANSRLADVRSLSDFKGYFARSFRYFQRSTPQQLLMQFLASAKDEKFRIFCQWLNENCPNVMRELVPLNEREFQKLRKHLGPQRLMKIIISINERKDTVEKYYSLYRLIIRWVNSERNWFQVS